MRDEDDIESNLDAIEIAIRECLDRIDHNLGFLDCLTQAKAGRSAESMRIEHEDLNERYDRARATYRRATASRTAGRADALVRLQIAVRDLELAVMQARAKHDAGRAVSALADLFATRRW